MLISLKKRKVFENVLRDTRINIFLRNKKIPTILGVPIFDKCFDKFSEKSKNREKQWKSKKICFWYIFIVLASSQKNLNFQRSWERVRLLTRYF